MLENLEWLTIIEILAIFAASAFCGVAVQRTARFVWPHDVFTISIIALFLADFVFVGDSNPFPMSWWAFGLSGYLIGYCASSRKEYVNFLDINLGTASINMPYVVPYAREDKQYVQDQTNIALLKRIIFHVEHEIDCPVQLRPTHRMNVEIPMYYVPQIEFLPVESLSTKTETVRKDKRIKLQKKTTTVNVAPAGMTTKMEMMIIEDAHVKDVETNRRLRDRLIRSEQTSMRDAVADAAEAIRTAFVDSSPGMQMHKVTQENKSAPTQAAQTVAAAKKRLLWRKDAKQ